MPEVDVPPGIEEMLATVGVGPLIVKIMGASSAGCISDPLLRSRESMWA